MIPCGTYPNLSFAEYVELPLVNFSTLKEMRKSAKHYLHRSQVSREDTPAMRLGRGVHLATLEPDAFDRLPTPPAVKSRNAKAWKEHAAKHPDALLLTADEVSTCNEMADRVHRHPIASEMLSVGSPEFTIVWELEGVQCKSRVDHLGKHAIVDLKTARDITPDSFARDAARYGYHQQAAFYTDAVEHATGNRLPFYIIAVESAPPHDVVVYHMPAEAVEQGRKDVQGYIRKWKRCKADSRWPGISTEVLQLELPTWAFIGGDEL